MRLFLLGFCYSFILSATIPALAGGPPAKKAKAAATAPRLDAWVWLRGDDDTSMSGSDKDVRAALLQQKDDEPLLWVRRAGKAYVIRDQAVLTKLTALWAPTEAIGKQMEAVGKQMELIGRQMETVGAKMGKARVDNLEALGLHMEELGRKMEPLGHQMEQLGKDMERMIKQAEADLAVVVDDAIKSGKATEVK
jgi:hypothetical protein